MKMWGCHDHRPYIEYVWVPDGYVEEVQVMMGVQTFIRTPKQIRITNPMSKDCKYSLEIPDDPRCNECRWKLQSIAEGSNENHQT